MSYTEVFPDTMLYLIKLKRALFVLTSKYDTCAWPGTVHGFILFPALVLESFTHLGCTSETCLIIQRGKSGLVNQKVGKKKKVA